jgi:peroxiredoxin Q/BCP
VRYWEVEHLPFIGLPDPKHVIANLYGQEVNLFKLGRVPALMVIDKKGQVRFQQ